MAEPTYSQIAPKASPQVQPHSSTLQFSQDLNIFDWIYSLNYQKRLPSGLSVSLNEQYQATLQSISTQDRWKDTQDFSLNFDYSLTQSLSLNTTFMSHILSDPLAGFDNDVTFYSGSARVTYRPTMNFLIAPKISSKWQTQVEQSDQGFGLSVDSRMTNLDFEGYQSDLSVLAERDFFPERANDDFRIRYQIEREFSDSTADTLNIFFNRFRRDSFDADASGIFVRNLVQVNRGFENRLRYRLAPAASIFVRSSVSSNAFKVGNIKDSEIDVRKDDAGFESKHFVRLDVNKERWVSSVSWNFRTRSLDDRRPQETIRDPFGRHPSLGFDTDENYTNLDLRAGYKVSQSDSVGIFASAAKFQFDTSDTTNPNDHDQLQWQLTFSHKHSFGPKLKVLWRGSAFLNHFVYLSGKFSSGNNWERVLQLTPRIVYHPTERLSFQQSFTVRAKYQTYDFDDPETSNRNIVNRQFVLANRSSYAFAPSTALEVGFNLELSEQGKLFYDLWRQRLALSWQNQQVHVQVEHRFGQSFVIRPGAQIFRQTRWNHSVSSDGAVNKRIRDRHTNWGPILELSYRPSPSVEFAFLGNVQTVKSSGRPTESLNNFDINLNWFF